jgi:DNA-binding transcriptional ArsR family regulator
MIRLHFTGADFARTSISRHPAPLVELKLSLMMLRRRDNDVFFGRWRRRLRTSLPATTRPLWDLVSGYRGPPFIDPVSVTVPEGLNAIHATPAERIKDDIERVYAHRTSPPPPWLRDLPRGDASAWHLLRRALEDCLPGGPGADLADGARPAPSRIHPVRADRRRVRREPSPDRPGTRQPAHRSRHLAAHRAISAGHPPGRARPHPAPHVPLDRHAARRRPARAAGPAGLPGRPGLPVPPPGGHQDPLPAILGQTRSRVLRLLADEHTTSEIARLAQISPASASGHVAALRAAGLTTTTRDGARARHRRTSLGTLLAD